jgi:transposase
VVGQFGIPVSRAGFECLRAFLGTLAATPEEILIGVEATGHDHLTLVEDLVRASYAVVLIHPYRAAPVPSLGRTQGQDGPH